MAEIRGFLFDLDGTLVDTHDSNYYAYRQATKDITKLLLSDELKVHIVAGKSSNEFLYELLPTSHQHSIPEINARKKEIYSQYMEYSRINTFLVEFLRHVSQSAITVLVTTAKQANAQVVINHHGFAQHFTHFVFGDHVTNMKPDPEAYEYALRITGLGASEVLAFEDSDSGIKAATAAGINTVRIHSF